MGVLDILKEIRIGIYKTIVIRSLLNASVIYLLSYFFFMIFLLPSFYISSIIALIYFIYEIIRLSRNDPLLMVEEKYPSINEQIRTVKDNLSEKNELIEELKKEVSIKVKKNVDVGDFLDFKKIISKVLVIFFMSFLIMLVASLNIRFLAVHEVIDLSKDFVLDLSSKILLDANQKLNVITGDNELKDRFKKMASAVGTGGGDLESGEIFGEAELAQLGNEIVNIQIRPTEYELSIDDFKQPERLNFISKSLSEDEVFSEKGIALDENLPRENREIVRRYFHELAKS